MEPVNDEHRLPLAVGLDVFVIVLFAAAGRRTHDQGAALTSVLNTAAPFLIGLAIAWLLVRAWRRPTAVLVGVAIWPLTVLAGMILRRALWDRGTAASFVLVTTVFVGACLVGWRLVLATVDRRRRLRTPSARIRA